MTLFPRLRLALRYQLQLFFTALQMFTRLPAPRWVGFAEEWLPAAVRYFPAIGVVVSAVCIAVFWITAIVLPQPLAVLLSMAAGIYLTGAFHEDGFADVCDGFGGGRQASQVVDIMRDSRVGAYGVVGVVLLMATKAVSLTWLSAAQVMAALLVAHPASRCLAAALIWRMDYVGDQGKAHFLVRRISTTAFWVSATAAILPIAVCVVMTWLTWKALLVAMLCGIIATVFLGRMFFRRIGGYTGDCLGAVQQLSEVAIYLGLVAATSALPPH